jgi:hypothetical protein
MRAKMAQPGGMATGGIGRRIGECGRPERSSRKVPEVRFGRSRAALPGQSDCIPGRRESDPIPKRGLEDTCVPADQRRRSESEESLRMNARAIRAGSIGRSEVGLPCSRRPTSKGLLAAAASSLAGPAARIDLRARASGPGMRRRARGAGRSSARGPRLSALGRRRHGHASRDRGRDRPLP